jgi:hypothetical protein
MRFEIANGCALQEEKCNSHSGNFKGLSPSTTPFGKRKVAQDKLCSRSMGTPLRQITLRDNGVPSKTGELHFFRNPLFGSFHKRRICMVTSDMNGLRSKDIGE